MNDAGSYWIISWWDNDRECNHYRIRGIGDAYIKANAILDALPSGETTFVDWPWAGFIFNDTNDERKFLASGLDIEADREHPPRDPQTPKIQCVSQHGIDLEADILLAILNDEITKQIDAEILTEILKIAREQ